MDGAGGCYGDDGFVFKILHKKRAKASEPPEEHLSCRKASGIPSTRLHALCTSANFAHRVFPSSSLQVTNPSPATAFLPVVFQGLSKGEAQLRNWVLIAALLAKHRPLVMSYFNAHSRIGSTKTQPCPLLFHTPILSLPSPRSCNQSITPLILMVELHGAKIWMYCCRAICMHASGGCHTLI